MSRSDRSPDRFTIDCDACAMQGTDACDDCVVTFVVGAIRGRRWSSTWKRRGPSACSQAPGSSRELRHVPVAPERRRVSARARQSSVAGFGAQRLDRRLLLRAVRERVEAEDAHRVLVGDLGDLVVGNAVELLGQRLG